ncbi:MAG: hypothetical protein WBE76_04055 [Terracidiphilus sp.]
MEIRAQPLESAEQLSLDEARQIADQICALATAQRDAPQKSPYILMSRAEREAYERRRDQIKQLGEMLARFKVKDTDAVD